MTIFVLMNESNNRNEFYNTKLKIHLVVVIVVNVNDDDIRYTICHTTLIDHFLITIIATKTNEQPNGFKQQKAKKIIQIIFKIEINTHTHNIYYERGEENYERCSKQRSKMKKWNEMKEYMYTIERSQQHSHTCTCMHIHMRAQMGQNSDKTAKPLINKYSFIQLMYLCRVYSADDFIYFFSFFFFFSFCVTIFSLSFFFSSSWYFGLNAKQKPKSDNVIRMKRNVFYFVCCPIRQ